MKIALLVAFVAICCVVVVAQHPRHCESPLELEAHGFQFDPKLQFFRRGRLFYDGRQERIAEVEEVVNGTTKLHLHTIHLFRERKLYVMDLDAKTCTVRDEFRRFHHLRIPRDAHFIGEAIVGTNAFDNAGVLTTHWEHHNDTEKTHWFGVFTDRDVGCLPVMDHFHDEAIGTVHTDFFDIVLGISDPNIFVPDQSCQNALKQHKRPVPVRSRRSG